MGRADRSVWSVAELGGVPMTLKKMAHIWASLLRLQTVMADLAKPYGYE